MNTSLNQMLFDTDTLKKINTGVFNLSVPVIDNEYMQYDKINNVLDLNNNDITLSHKRKYINLTDVLYNRTEFEKIIDCKFNYFTFTPELSIDEEDMLAQAEISMYETTNNTNLISDTLMCTNIDTGEQQYLNAIESDTISSTNCLLSPNKKAIAIIQSDGNFCVYMNTDTSKNIINDDYTLVTPNMCVWNTGWSDDIIDYNGVGDNYDGSIDIHGNKYSIILNKNNKYQYKRKDVNNHIEKSITYDDKLIFEHHRPFVYIKPQTMATMNDGGIYIGRDMCYMLGNDIGWFIKWKTDDTSTAISTSKAAYLKLDDNGILTLYNQGGLQLWSSRY